MTAPSHDDKWLNLLGRSASTFDGESEPPFGFVTQTLARLKTEKREREILEKIGLRAIFASLAILVATGGLTLGMHLQDRFEADPSLRGILQMEDFPIA